MNKKLSPEQERLLNYLKAGQGSQPKTHIVGLFSRTTVDSLIDKALIIDSFADGCYKVNSGG